MRRKQIAGTDRPREYLRTNSLCLPRQEPHHASFDLFQFFRLPRNVHNAGARRVPSFTKKQVAQLMRNEMPQNHSVQLLVSSDVARTIGEDIGNHTKTPVYRQEGEAEDIAAHWESLRHLVGKEPEGKPCGLGRNVTSSILR